MGAFGGFYEHVYCVLLHFVLFNNLTSFLSRIFDLSFIGMMCKDSLKLRGHNDLNKNKNSNVLNTNKL